MFKYAEMDRKGKPSHAQFPYRRIRAERIFFMAGYIEGKLEYTPNPLISRSWYKDKYGLSRATIYKDIKELTTLYPQIIWIK
jgi:hypothetical protein